MLSSKQREYLAACNHRWNFKIGATGSGKSWLDYAVVIPKRLLALKSEGAAVLLGNTQGTLSRNILDPMREIWGEALVGTISSDNTVRLFGRRVHVLGADNKKHVARIQGMTIEYAYGDEVTIDDNPALDPAFVAELKKELAGTVYYNRFILGQWCAAEGIIYRLFADSQAAHDGHFLWPADKPLPPGTRVHIGVDFGGNGSKHAFVATGILPDAAGVVGLCSARVDPKDTDTAFLAGRFVDFVQQVFASWGEIHTVFCDSAEQVLKNSLRSALLATRFSWLASRVYNAKKIEINDRIRLTSILMGGGRFWYMPGAQTLADALATTLWSGKTPGQDTRLDDGTTDIDTLDAFEYTIERERARLLRLAA